MAYMWDSENTPQGTKVYSSHGNELEGVVSVSFHGADDKRGPATVELLVKDSAGLVVLWSDGKKAARSFVNIWCEVVLPGDNPVSSFPVTAWSKKVLVDSVEWVQGADLPTPTIIEES